MSVVNSPSPFVQGSVWPLCWPMQRSPTMAYICLPFVYDHVSRWFLYRGILNLATKCQLNTDCTSVVSVVGVEYYNFNSGHQGSSQPLMWTACFGLFNLSTCSSLLIG